MLLNTRILADLGQFVIANEVFLVEMKEPTIPALHDFRRSFNIQFKQL